jgi:hypothetical protein
MRGRQHRVLPLGNRRRAGMVREAGHDGVVLVDRHDPLDDADWDAGAFERAALLDVQLEITVVRALRPARLENPIRVAADALDRLTAAHAVPDLVHVSGGDLAGDNPAARKATAERESLFVRPHHHFERMPRADVGRLKRFENAEGGERAEVAVEIAAVRHRVDVRSEQDGRELRLGTYMSSEDVARRIDPRLEPCGGHQSHDVAAAFDVGV